MKVFTINEVYQRLHESEQFNIVFKEFLDGINLYRKENSDKHLVKGLFGEPNLVDLANGSYELKIAACMCAGLVENICSELELNTPAWIDKDAYFLKEPYFPTNGQRARNVFMATTPSFYRKRNLFVGEILSGLHLFK